MERDSQKTMGEFLEVCPRRQCISTVGKRTDLFGRDPYKVPITDFFGSVRNVELTDEVMRIHGANANANASSKENDDDSDKKSYEYETGKVYDYLPRLPVLETLK